MKNLTTRKIVFGVLMTLVLAFSVQGTADALTTSLSGDPADFETLNIGETITLTLTGVANLDTVKESVKLSVSGGGAKFPIGDSQVASHTWYEVDNSDPLVRVVDGAVNNPDLVVVTVSSAGKVTVKLTDTSSTSSANRVAEQILTLYVVKHRLDVGSTETISLLGVTNGVGSGYDNRQPVQIYRGDSGNNPVEYTVAGGGNLYIRDGNRNSGSDISLETSSTANVYLSMGTDNTNTVTVQVANNDSTQGIYIYGRPTLAITTDPTGTDLAPFEGSPGQQLNDAITVVVNDQDDDGTLGDPVVGVPVKFDVADKDITGSDLSYSSNTDDGEKVDRSNNVLINPPVLDRTLHIRTKVTGAVVNLGLGSAPGKAEINVSIAGKNFNVSEKVEVRITSTGAVTEDLSESANTKRSGNSKIFDLVALVEESGEGKSSVAVTFRTVMGILTNTPADPNTNAVQTGRIVTETTDALGKARVTYNIGENTGRQLIFASINDTDANTRQEITFTVNGPAQQVDPGTGDETGTTLSVSSENISGAPGSSPSFSVTAPTNARVTIGRRTDSFITAGGEVSSRDFIGPRSISLTLPSTADSYTLTVDSGTQSISITITVTTTDTTTTTGTLSLDVPASGAAGDRLLVTITVDPAAAINVTLGTTGGIGTLSRSTVATNSSGVGTATLTLGAAGSTGFVTASATEYDTRRLRVTVTGNPADSLSITSGSNQRGAPDDELDNPFVVTVLDEDNDPVSGVTVTFSVISGGGSLSATSVQTNSRGRASTVLTLGDDPGRNSVRARAAGVSRTVTFNATATGAAAELVIDSGNNQRGALNEELDDSLIVQVLDDDGNGVNDVSVLFRVTPGQGRLSQLGNGSAVRDRTDRRGFAEADFTPMGAGTITITARSGSLDPVTFTVTTGPPPASLDIVSGDNQAGTPGDALADPLVVEVQDAEGDAVDGVTVTFEVTAGGGSLSATTATTNASGRAQTTLTLGGERGINSVQASVSDLDPVTFNTSIDPVVHVAAANRPVMYWIDGGMLYRLASAKAEQIAANASDVAVDAAGGKIYWTEKTSNNTGKIHSANLDGSGAQVLKDLSSLPYGLALDSANGKLYLTNSRSKIRRMNIDGTQFEPNFIQGLSAPMNIAVSSGRVYWTEEGGNVRFANVEGTKVVRDIATGSGTLGGIAIGGNKVYWTEQTDETTGRVRSANLNGTGVAEVITLATVPHGIAVDIADGKIFWADNQGRIQRIRIDNLKLLNVVTGLMAPSALALGVANTADATPPAATPVTKDTSVYDVNGDGTVDNTDAGLVANALGTSNAKYDVNGDGNVNFLDLLLVFDNREEAAGAPTVGRARLTAVQVDRIQEQIDLLLATNDRSPAALYTLTYLQNLLAAARPAKTQLLANYPNPFNPETWIPYELATDTNVQITIYDVQGVIIRTLSLGHQSAGYYTGRDRAAYWDGRNAFGEQVASGLYFYQFETDTMSLMRKMVILK